MDFEPDDEQRELQGLAAGLLGREVTAERLTAFEDGGAAYDTRTWKALAQAGLLGACLPTADGGAGLGAVGLAVVLREIGAHVAPVPAYASLALGAMTIARHGSPAQRALLPALAAGDVVLTGAAREPGTGEVRTTASRAGDSYVLDGVKTFVPYAAVASHILIPARVVSGPREGAHPRPPDERVAVFLVEAAEVEQTRHPATTGEPMSRVALPGVRVGPEAVLGDGAWDTLRRYAVAGAVATVSGVAARALELTTEHVKTREQFGRVLAAFQAVTMQIGDVYIAVRALDVAMWAGVWRLATEQPDTDEVLAIAAYNACDPVLKALYTCQHLHGGIGLDVTYPLHRYFAWGKHYAHLLGGAAAQLDAIAAAGGDAGAAAVTEI